MKDQYGSKEGEQVFYASRNKGILPKVEKANKGKSFGAPPKKGPASDGFDPEGSGYDYKNAPPPSFKELGYFPKYGSLDPKTGMVLKGRKHKSYDETLKAEEKLGNKIIKKGDRYFSVKKKVFGGMGCPHREMGVKSDIQGVKDIQVKGKSFKGVK
jgi:hypothetical protein